MSEILFNGVWRMDWGLGNPNKTAALIAVLMIAVWGLAYVRRWGFWVALPLFSALGVCLVHTFSRGGVVAAFCGLTPLVLALRRPWPRSRMIAVIIGLWLLVGASVFLQAHKRYGQGVASEDRSISNRFEIWKAAPSMMVDAPGGWGIGKSGRAYMNWYQPLEQNEAYRTLVNSHLTWLVEFGWLGRFFYVAGWLAIFLICLPGRQERWLAVPLGIWIAFFVGAFFSSVAESVWLWTVPGVALAWVVAWRLWNRDWLPAKFWALPPAAAAVCLLILALSAKDSPVQKTNGAVLVGGTSPETWVVLNKKVLGENPGRTLRAALPDLNGKRLALVESVRFLPAQDLGEVVLAGQVAPEDREDAAKRLQQAKSVTLLNPGFFPQELAIPKQVELHVLVGEFSQEPATFAWADGGSARRLIGTGDFVPNWPQAVFASGL